MSTCHLILFNRIFTKGRHKTRERKGNQETVPKGNQETVKLIFLFETSICFSLWFIPAFALLSHKIFQK